MGSVSNASSAVTLVGTSTISVSGTADTDVVISAESSWTTPINNFRIDSTPSSTNGAIQDVSTYNAAWVLIDIDSTATPGSLRVVAQFSDDSGTTWWDYEEGLWASLSWEDTDTASGINKAYLLPCGGQDDMRIRVVGTNTTTTGYFDVTVKTRAFRGNFATGHA